MTKEYLWDLFLKQNRKCALSGLPLQFSKTVRNKIDTTASLDRIDSTKGYMVGNVQWVHKRINIMKMGSTQADFIQDCKAVVDHQSIAFAC